MPERREEVTTEGGLDVERYFDQVRDYTRQLSAAGIRVSLFIDPTETSLSAAVEAGAAAAKRVAGLRADLQAADLLLARLRQPRRL